LSFVDTAIINVARDRADGLVATFDRKFSKVDGLVVVPD
jgi:predicted nucleic acid-binding protein